MPGNRSANNAPWYLIIALLSVAVGCVMAVLIYLLAAPPPPPRTVTPTPTRLAFTIATSAPSAPALHPTPDIKFQAQEPVKGFSSCGSYGLNGKIVSTAGQPVARMQVVMWADDAGNLLALATSAADGAYRISINGPPTGQNVRVQLYRADRPVSEPLLLKIYIDCENGFQTYQVNWQELPAGQN